MLPARGVVFTGRMRSGTVRTGRQAEIALPGGPRAVTVEAIDVRRRKRERADAGEEAGLHLAGFTADDISRALGAGGAVQEDGPLRGVQISAGP
ncbi:hypothetical protein [Streptomyces pinistramenti]|uniref:hypothetical protein n=1 Tax=Streptomyces pinistramenti TaxID=2884812 RepID=UPI001D0935B5|nr:hypothetical protein [Streptomyces pinistramenti]MCB5910711.1 hypothetical protein [Streptomyces pinistramenti]